MGAGGLPSPSFPFSVLLQSWRSSKKLGACSTLSIQKLANSVFCIPPPINLVPLCVILPQIRVPTKHPPLKLIPTNPILSLPSTCLLNVPFEVFAPVSAMCCLFNPPFLPPSCSNPFWKLTNVRSYFL